MTSLLARVDRMASHIAASPVLDIFEADDHAAWMREEARELLRKIMRADDGACGGAGWRGNIARSESWKHEVKGTQARPGDR
jgi:hypothetical protein